MRESEYYTWGKGCEAWKLTDTPELSVIKERMPVGTSEKLHYHKKSQQLFYILKGTATFEIESQEITVSENENIHILPEQKHRIINKSDKILEFLVISQPRAHGDRFDS